MFTGITPEKQEIDLEQVSLLDLAGSALELSRAIADRRGVRLSCNSFHSFPPMLLDPRLITEAIHALVGPAVASAPELTGVDLMLAGRDDTAELVIKWRGAAVGGPEKPDPLPERPQRIIEAHNGTLKRVIDNAGSCSLTITLPVIRPAMQMDALDTTLHDRDIESHQHILLAEDSPMARNLTASLLEKRGHSVTQVDNGNEAVRTFLVGNFNLVLMDIQMPGMNGFEAAETIRRLDSGRGGQVPIVALTASDLEINLQHCLDAGMDAMLSKPFRSREFDLLLKQLKAEAREKARREQLANRETAPA